jgi:hypothetical protein
LVACKLSFVDILNKIKELNLPLSNLFTKELVQHIYDTMYKTNPAYFNPSITIPDSDWLRSLGVLKYVANEFKLAIPEGIDGIAGALEIVKDPEMYKVLTAMALAKVTEEDLELLIGGKYNVHYELEDIKQFFHYFFNVSTWSLSQKRDYVNDIKDTNLVRAYKLALEGDKEYLMWSLGIAPNKSFDNMLRELGTDAFYFFKKNSKTKPEEAQKWANLVMRLAERHDKLDRESVDNTAIDQFAIWNLKGHTDDDLHEKIIDNGGSLVIARRSGKRHIADVLKEEEETNDE